MRALALLGDRKLELTDLPPPPPPAEGEVQIRVRAVGLNHVAFTVRELSPTVRIVTSARSEEAREILTLAGGTNLFPEVEAESPQISMEEILRRRPEVTDVDPSPEPRQGADAPVGIVLEERDQRVAVGAGAHELRSAIHVHRGTLTAAIPVTDRDPPQSAPGLR